MKVLRNGTATAFASDHLWSMVLQNVASECVYTSATWGVPNHAHVYLSVPGVRKQYTGFHVWTSPCFMYVHGSSLLISLKQQLLRFLLGKYSVWKLKKD